jgi:hypothetical protein
MIALRRAGEGPLLAGFQRSERIKGATIVVFERCETASQ